MFHSVFPHLPCSAFVATVIAYDTQCKAAQSQRKGCVKDCNKFALSFTLAKNALEPE